jgi:hypothetical protein
MAGRKCRSDHRTPVLSHRVSQFVSCTVLFVTTVVAATLQRMIACLDPGIGLASQLYLKVSGPGRRGSKRLSRNDVGMDMPGVDGRRQS